MALKAMKLNRFTLAGALACAAATVTLAMPAVRSQGTPTIKIDGSSTVFPITEAVAEEFQKDKRGSVRVTVGVSGTGGGFKKFCSDNLAVRTDISDASRPIKDEEKAACEAAGVKYMEIPVAYDGITVVVNPSNTWADNMTVEELKTMWEPAAEGSVEQWNDVRSSWPEQELVLFAPGADSGTFDYFTDEIVGESGASRTDYTPSEDDNVLVQGVVGDPNALAYFGIAYYLENQDQLKAVAVNGVKPTLETVSNGSYTPLSRPLFIYVNTEAAKSKPEVKEFVEYYLQNAPALVEEVGYVPRSDYQESMSSFQASL